MVREYIVKAACVLLLVGFAAGIIGQVELLQPGAIFTSQSLWSQIITLHVWAMSVSLVVIGLSTISLIRQRKMLGQWAVWIGFCIVPFLFGVLLNLMLANPQLPQSFLDTTYITANRHSYGTAALLVALGGLSSLQRVRFESLPLKISFGFALMITITGVATAFLQARLGMFGLPRGYFDYPREFAQLQFYASIAAITCFSLSAIYVILLWRCAVERSEKAAAVF